MIRARASASAVGADAVVIGAGPAGLCCAIFAAAGGRRVIVLEKNRTPLVKLSLAGAGRCNITHAGPIEEFLPRYGDRGRFVKPALFGFTNDDLARLLARRGLETIAEQDGRVFPATHGPAGVREALTAECAAVGAKIGFGEPVRGVARTGGGFEIRTGRALYEAGSCVIATGGLSYPRTGSTGDGHAFARGLGHAIVETAPALAPVIAAGYRFSRCAGISTEAGISLLRAGRTVRRARGDILFTHRGLSGPAVLDMSRHVRRGDLIVLSLGGCETAKEMRELIDRAAGAHGRRSIRHCLAPFGIPARLAARVLELAGIDPSMKASQADRAARRLIAESFTRLEIAVARLGGFGEAMVTRGGVDTGEIDRRTMESRLVPGLHVVGEALDVDGDTGGFNLQWAFSSGAAAGREIARRPTAVSP